MAKQTLLEKAKSSGRKNETNVNITDEHIELALGWVRGEVSYSQVKRALDLTVPSTIYSFLCFALRKHIQKLEETK